MAAKSWIKTLKQTITSLLLLFQTRLCLTFQPLFSLRSWKSTSFTLPFLLSYGLYSPILSQDWYLRYWPSLVFSSDTHFATIHRHIIHANFYVIWLVSVYINKWSLICSTFLGTIDLLHFTPLQWRRKYFRKEGAEKIRHEALTLSFIASLALL